MKKTPLMIRVEEEFDDSLENILPQLYNEMGLEPMADLFGVKKATAWYWLLKFGIRIHRVAVPEGHDVYTKRNGVKRLVPKSPTQLVIE